MCGAIRQHIDRLLLFQIDQKSAIGLAATQGEIVDPKDARGSYRWERRGAHEPQQGIRATGQPQLAPHERSSFCANGKSQDTESIREACRAPRVRLGELRKRFGKDFPDTGGIGTVEPPHMQHDSDRLSTAWQILDGSPIAALHTAGSL